MECLSFPHPRRGRQKSLTPVNLSAMDDIASLYQRKQSFCFQFENMLRKMSNTSTKILLSPTQSSAKIAPPTISYRSGRSSVIDSCPREISFNDRILSKPGGGELHVSNDRILSKPGGEELYVSHLLQRVHVNRSMSDEGNFSLPVVENDAINEIRFVHNPGLCNEQFLPLPKLNHFVFSQKMLPASVPVQSEPISGSCPAASEATCRQNLADSTQRLGRFHRESIQCMEDLARCLQLNEQWFLAENCYDDCLEAREMIHGYESAEAISIVDSLALCLRAQGKLERSITLNRRALDVRGKILGMDHISTLKTAHNFALCLEEAENFVEAEQLHIRAVLGFENTLGSLDVNTLKATNNLARIFHMRSKLPEAESLYCRLLRSKIKVYGQNDIRTLSTVVSLAAVLQDSGKIVGARDLYKCALLGYSFCVGMDNERVQGVFSALTDMLSKNEALLLDSIHFYSRLRSLSPILDPPNCLEKLLEEMTTIGLKKRTL